MLSDDSWIICKGTNKGRSSANLNVSVFLMLYFRQGDEHKPDR